MSSSNGGPAMMNAVQEDLFAIADALERADQANEYIANPTNAAPTNHLQALPLPDASLWFLPQAALSVAHDQLFTQLLNETPWRSESIQIYGKTMLQPRLMALYGDPLAIYTYSRRQYQPLPWTSRLHSLREEIQQICGEQFNSVLLNYYRDGQDSMGMHADDEKELGPQPAIASLSLGAPRSFIFKHQRRKDLAPLRILLGNGALLLMKGPTQANWLHGINKQASACGPRINLTFRKII